MKKYKGKISTPALFLLATFIVALIAALIFYQPIVELGNDVYRVDVAKDSSQAEIIPQNEQQSAVDTSFKSIETIESEQYGNLPNDIGIKTSQNNTSNVLTDPAKSNNNQPPKTLGKTAPVEKKEQENTKTPSISGRVLDPEGNPLSNIKITAILRDYFNQKDAITDKPDTLRTESNAEGYYAFQELLDGIYLLSANSNKRFLPKRIEARTGLVHVDIVLAEMGIINLKGKITDESSSRVLSEVQITPILTGSSVTLSSDANGEFNFELAVGEQISFPLRLQKENYRTSRFNVNISDPNSYQNLQISMQQVVDLGELSGQITGDKNETMDALQVKLYSPSLKKNYSAKTDDDGEFLIENIEQADDYNLWIRPTSKYKDFGINRLSIGTRKIRKDIQLESVDSGYELSGQVLDQENNPIANMSLSFRSLKAQHQVVRVTTDVTGAYHAENVPEGQITIKSNGSPHFTLTGLVLNGNNRNIYRDLVVDHGEQKLIGKVLDSNGDPISTPQIYLSSMQMVNGLRSQSSRKTSSDNEGKFLFTDLGSRQYSLSANAHGYKSGRMTVVLGTQSEYVIRLHKNPR